MESPGWEGKNGLWSTLVTLLQLFQPTQRIAHSKIMHSEMRVFAEVCLPKTCRAHSKFHCKTSTCLSHGQCFPRRHRSRVSPLTTGKVQRYSRKNTKLGEEELSGERHDLRQQRLST